MSLELLADDLEYLHCRWRAHVTLTKHRAAQPFVPYQQWVTALWAHLVPGGTLAFDSRYDYRPDDATPGITGFINSVSIAGGNGGAAPWLKSSAAPNSYGIVMYGGGGGGGSGTAANTVVTAAANAAQPVGVLQTNTSKFTFYMVNILKVFDGETLFTVEDDGWSMVSNQRLAAKLLARYPNLLDKLEQTDYIFVDIKPPLVPNNAWPDLRVSLGATVSGGSCVVNTTTTTTTTTTTIPTKVSVGGDTVTFPVDWEVS